MIDYSEEISRRVRGLMEENASPVVTPSVVKKENNNWIIIAVILFLVSGLILFIQNKSVENKVKEEISRLEKTEKDICSIKKRIWVLGLVTNENTHLQRSYSPDKKGSLTLNEDWKIEKIPETMALTPEQKEMLKDWVIK